jgi:hypothetical protein
MSAMESFLLGIMVAWTPSLAVMGWLLWSAPRRRFEDQPDALDY